jgi:hypothetical protein
MPDDRVRMCAQVRWTRADGIETVKLVRFFVPTPASDRLGIQEAVRRAVTSTARLRRFEVVADKAASGAAIWTTRSAVYRRKAQGVGHGRHSFDYVDGTVEVKLALGWDEVFDQPPCDCMDCSINGEPTHG